jgi:hypothetical protein
MPNSFNQVDQQSLDRLKKLAWLMDESIVIPGLGFKIGVDGIIGLIPGVGDIVTTGISTYIVRQAQLLGVPKVVLLRMVFNVAIDFVVGAIPLLGDLFDMGWKANRRNLRLALDYFENPSKVQRWSWMTAVGLASGVLLAISLLIVTTVALVSTFV